MYMCIDMRVCICTSAYICICVYVRVLVLCIYVFTRVHILYVRVCVYLALGDSNTGVIIRPHSLYYAPTSCIFLGLKYVSLFESVFFHWADISNHGVSFMYCALSFRTIGQKCGALNSLWFLTPACQSYKATQQRSQSELTASAWHCAGF